MLDPLLTMSRAFLSSCPEWIGQVLCTPEKQRFALVSVPAGMFRMPKTANPASPSLFGKPLIYQCIGARSEAGLVTKVIGNSPTSAFVESRETLNSSECLSTPGENMDQKIQSGSPESAEIHNLLTEENLELWEPPFDRWLRLTDDLLRGWPHPATNHENQHSEM